MTSTEETAAKPCPSTASGRRTPWVDVLKFLGMMAIYVGHMDPGSGPLRTFVFGYHVPLFFFMSGFFATRHTDVPFASFCKAKFVRLYLPYLFFIVLTIVTFVLTDSVDAWVVKSWMYEAARGVRGQMFVGQLWFFLALLVTALLYEALRRACRGRSALLLVICVLAGYAMAVAAGGEMPHWLFSADYGVLYLPYYALGAWAYPLITRLFEKLEGRSCTEGTDRDTLVVRRWAAVAFVLLALYAASFYLRGDVLQPLLYGMPPVAFEYVHLAYGMLRTVLLIAFNVGVAGALQRVGLFAEIGASSLWLCGNETIVKTFVSEAFSLVGLTVLPETQFAYIVYAFPLLLLVCRVLMPVEKRIYAWLGSAWHAVKGR